MADGLRWIGEYSNEDAKGGVPGMRGSISLTAARGVEAEEFLVRLGADDEQLRCRDLYKDRHELAIPAGVDLTQFSLAMYGTCGDWVYVLEDGFAATWFLGYRKAPEMEPQVGEEIICLTLNHHDAPSLLLHAPGADGRTRETEFRGSTDWSSELDAALRAVGAVFPSLYDGVSTEEEVELYYEAHAHEIPARVFAGVGNYCDLAIDRTTVEAGLLPLAVLAAPSI
ncbi:hypothetical protein [Streptomyces sp. NPDC050738]|uniref:hypothetical protein n=1 Tax=Streptomyces sp. NPDC050738 TaxID=3154744 RepID=UPI0034475AA6